MMAWYSAPQSLAPPGASPDETSGVCGGTGRCRTCLAAIARLSGRRAARALSVTSRSRAKRGRLLNGHCAAARGRPRGLDDSVGRAEGNKPWREVSRVTEERSDVVPPGGAAHEGRRAEWLAGQVSSGHAAVAACDGRGIRVKGPCRNSLRGPDCLRAEPDRPAKLNRTPARAADAAPGAVESPAVPHRKRSEAQRASSRRAALRAVSRLADRSTRGR